MEWRRGAAGVAMLMMMAAVLPALGAPETQAGPAATQAGAVGIAPEMTAESRFRDAFKKAERELPESLRTARGDDYFIAHVQAIAALKSPEAREFAGLLTEILRKHKFKLSPELEKLPPVAAPAANVPAPSAPTIASMDDNVQLMAILSNFADPDPVPEKPLYDSPEEIQQHIPVLIDLLEATALHAPSLSARIMAVIQLSSTESLMNSGLQEDEDLALTWVAPQRIAAAWDALWVYALDGSHGKLDLAAGTLMEEFDDELLAMYCISHGLAAAKPGKDVLTGPLSHLIDMASKTRAQMKAGEDAAALDDFIGRVKELGAELDDKTQGFIDRPAVQAELEKFIAAVGKGDKAAAVKSLTPDAEKAMPAPAELLGKLFETSKLFADKEALQEPKIFFVAAPEKGENDAAGYHVVFYLQAKGKGGRMRYARQEALMAKDGAAWRIQQITLVLDPDDEKKP